MMKTPLTVVVAALMACIAFGEVPTQAVGPPESVETRPEATYLAQFYWGPYGYYAGATPAGSYAMGVAALTRAQGEYNLLTARAMIATAEARRYELENRLRATELYFQARLLNREYRAKLRRPRPTPEELQRYAAAGRPDRLSPSELDTVTGQITWPILLRDDRYADYRAKLEALFADRAGSDELSTTSYLKIHWTTKALQDELSKRIARVPQMDYIAAKRFIQSLAYEARQPGS